MISMNRLPKIKGLLFDLDGVLYVGSRVIEGAIEAVEYAGNTKVRIIGKPSLDFFQIALDTMGFQPADVAIVGDDIDADVGGGQQAGLKGILVKTGKYRQSYAEASPVRPDLVIDSIRDLPGMLNIQSQKKTR
jgi:ribonucleotide monophosphatase NagD (HAD superfamily)